MFARLTIAFLSLTTLLGFGGAAYFWRQHSVHQAAPVASAAVVSPYVEQMASSIRGLSPQEISDLSEGAGMGMARAAELNSYPGPRHLLDARDLVKLTPEQAARIEEVRSLMSQQARTLGRRILQDEQALEEEFRGRSITTDNLKKRLAELETFRTELRRVHLEAHLAMADLLKP
ncbi:MAG: hypothetical protein NTZ05_05770, partial [Chloroflexi bacterium]|nr:hypothetical protein [Chloroflexota bacterium]